MKITHDNTLTNKQKDMDYKAATSIITSGVKEHPQGQVEELKRLQLEIDEYVEYGNWFTSESWNRDMTLEEEEKCTSLYNTSVKNTARIREIILNEL